MHNNFDRTTANCSGPRAVHINRTFVNSDSGDSINTTMVPRYYRYVYRKTLASPGIARHTIVLGTLSEAHRTPKPDWAPVTVPSQAHTHSLRGPCRSHQPVQEYRFRYHNRRELLTVVSINELPGTQLLENTVLSIKKLATR